MVCSSKAVFSKYEDLARGRKRCAQCGSRCRIAPLPEGLVPVTAQNYSASSVSLIGGGTHPKPGEVSLAHRGVLFLDEMAEFAKKTLDMLRQPLETGKVTISRISSTVTYPADFILLGAMNPCPCGYLGSRTRYCTCSPKQIQAYRNRVSGPIYEALLW